MKDNRIYCDHPANNYCNLNLQLSCLQFSNYPFAPILSEIRITCSFDDFRVIQAASMRQNSLTVETFYSKVLGYNRIQP